MIDDRKLRRGGDLLEAHDLGQEGLHEAVREVRLDRQITFLVVEPELADQARELINTKPRDQLPDIVDRFDILFIDALVPGFMDHDAAPISMNR